METESFTRVAAELYRGVRFPDDWASHSTDITTAMGRELIISVIALFDQGQAVAVCWEIADRGEQFARSRFDQGVDANILDNLDGDLIRLDQQMGVSPRMFSTLLWEPRTLTGQQAEHLRTQVFLRGRYSATFEWIKAPREIFASANDLVVMIRSIEKSVFLERPATASEMHQIIETAESETFVILPIKLGSAGAPSESASNGVLKPLIFAAAMLIAIALISAYLAGDV